MVCKHRLATISDDVVCDYCDCDSVGEALPCIDLVFQYQKRTSCLLGAGLAGCGNDDAN